MAYNTPGSRVPSGQTPMFGGTPPVSTPFSTARSSNLSPQQHRQAPGANHLHNNSFSGPAALDSPNTAMAIQMASDMIDNAHKASSFGSLGAGLQPAGRVDQDAIKLGKLNSIMSILGQVKGKVSEDGIERLARKIGMECLWDTGFGANPPKTLIIAGTGISVDIEFLNGVVQSVAVSFPDAAEAVQSHAQAMGNILHENLKDDGPAGRGMINFGRNLQRLATLDKLSVGNQYNCFEAIEGIYKSLNRLNKYEIEELIRRKGADTQQEAENIIQNTSTGKPLINAHGNVGLSIDYFTSRGEVSDKTWSVLVECEASPSMGFPPARISDNWIPENVVQQGMSQPAGSQQTTEFLIDWQQPENTFLPNTGQDSTQDTMAAMQIEKLADVRFVAKFEPALIISYDVATRLYGSVGLEYKPSTALHTFDELLSPSADPINAKTPNWRSKTLAEDLKHYKAYRCIRRENEFKIKTPLREEISRLHRTSIYFKDRDLCTKLTELPFSHPSQLVDLLPTLRQWARVTSLLDRAINVPTSQRIVSTKDEGDGDDWDSDSDDDFPPKPKRSGLKRSDGLLTRSSKDNAVYIDIQLHLSEGMPEGSKPKICTHLEVVRPDGKEYQVGIPVDIQWNGKLEGLEQFENRFVHASHGDLNMRPGKQHEMVKILEKAGDIGTWVEFLKQNKVSSLMDQD